VALKDIRYKLRKKISTGGSVPINAFYGEPFVNVFDGILYFSGYTGGSFIPAGGQPTVFEVGSKLTSLNINNNFIIGSGGTITEYAGVTNMAGQFLSGTTSAGMILANIADISSSAAGSDYNVQYNYGGEFSASSQFSYVASSSTLFVPSISASSLTIDNLNVLANTILGSATTAGGNIVPSVDGAYNLGSPSAYWQNVYAYNLAVSGITTNLTPSQIVYIASDGSLTGETGFQYNESTSTMYVTNGEIGSGGSIASPGVGDLVIHGNLTVYGAAISAYTGQLYIEDNRITMNFNPTGDTSVTSLGAGWEVQDGLGVSGTTAYFDIRGTGIGANNRSFATNLYDIRIRESGTTVSPNGVRVLTELDVLDGGAY